ncbi:MAG: hypothetical protein P4K94_05065 [Terracidiphilus sp.]|nr:hypothetical protein [Terracidiphilus sp.]
MRTNSALLVLTLCLTCIVVRAEDKNPESKCPVVIDHVELSYSHQGEPSKPQLRVGFRNNAGKQISAVTFGLSILDSGGYPRSYPDSLTYGEGLEAGQKKLFVWDLASESVDIHRAGETVVVQKIEYADATGWTDDGSESCMLKIDFHAR